jgi:hypothetical protein
VIQDSSQPIVLFPDKAYRFKAGRFVLNTTLILKHGQSCCISGSSNGSRTILLPPKPTPAAGNSTAKRHLHFALTGGRLMLRNITVSGYTGGSSKGGGGVLIQRAAVDEGDGGATLADTSATLVADHVIFRQVHNQHAA